MAEGESTCPVMASVRIPGLQVMSDLLTIREKGVLLSLLGPQCQLIKSTVAQVLVATETQDGGLGWTSLGCGVVCVTEDHSVHSYFLRLYCVKRAELLWEQEFYIPFKYTAAHKYFHTFPADNQQAGFNFADEAEAEEFHSAVKCVQKHQASLLLTVNTEDEEDEEDRETAAASDSGTKRVDDWDSQTYFPRAAASGSLRDVDPAMRRLLMQVKLTEDDLKNKDVAETVDSIINQFGGLKAVQRELNCKGSASKTLPRASVESISLTKGALSHSTMAFQKTPHRANTLDFCQFAFIPPRPSTAPPPIPQTISKTVSFKHINSASDSKNSDLNLSAVRDTLKQKQHQHK